MDALFPQSESSTLNHLFSILDKVPLAVVALRGENLIIEYINQFNLEIWQCRKDDVLGKPLFNARPDLRAGAEAMHREVYRTGNRFTANEIPLPIHNNGKVQTRYFNIVIEPIINNGEITGQLATSIEVTEEVLARNKNEDNENILQNIFLQAPVAVVIYQGENFIVQIANANALEIWGKREEEVLSRPLFDISPELKVTQEPVLLKVLTTGQPFVGKEYPVRLYKDGRMQTIYYDFVYTPIRSQDNKITGVISIGSEVTHSVLARKKIEESDEKLRIALESGSLGTYDFYPNSGKLEWSVKTKEFFGLPADFEVDYNTFLKGIHPEDKERSDAAIQKAIKQENGGIYENEYRTIGLTDGKLRWIKSKGKISFDEEGKPQRFTGIAQEITREKELMASLQLQSLVFESMDEGVSVSDESGIIRLTNPAEDRMFGYLPGELIGKHVTVQNAYSPDENQRVVNDVYTELRLKGIWKGEWHNRKKDGTEFYTHAFIKTMVADGETLYVCVQRDITEEKRKSEALAYRTALLEAQNEAVPDAILIVDTTGKVLSYNRQFIELWNLPKEIIEKKDDKSALEFAMTQIQDPVGFLERVNYCYQNPEIKARDEILFNDGRIIERFGNAVVGKGGKSYGWAWYFKDVTEQKKAQQGLTYQKSLLETVTDNTSLALFMMNDRQHCIYMNDAAKEMTGYSLEEVQGKQLHYFIHHTYPDGRPFPLEECPIDQALPEHKRMKGEEVFVHKDGSFFPVAFTASPIIINGTGIGTVIEVRNTAEDKKREQDLRLAKEQLELTFHNVPAAISLFDKSGNIIFTNENSANLIGYTSAGEMMEEKSVGKLAERAFEVIDIIDEEGKPITLENSPTYIALNTGRTAEALFQLVYKRDGTSKWILSKATALFDEEGKVVMVLTAGIDITIQKTAEQAIRQSEERFRTLAESLPQMIWMRNNQGIIEYASKNWERYSGISNISEAWKAMTHPDDWHLVMQTWENAMAAKKAFRHEVRLKNKAGEYRWHNAAGEPVRNQRGEVIKWIGALTDIHEQKTFAEKLEKEVAQRTVELIRSNEDLQQFAHVASHDLKEPVRKVMTFSGRLKDELGEAITERSITYLSKIEGAALRMYSMIDGVLQYSSMSAMEQTVEEVNLNKVLRDIEIDLEISIQQKNATIKYTTLPTVNGSSILLYQLFYNLLNNSLKFAKAGMPAEVFIDSTKEGNFHKISISDNGIGFRQNKAEAIFLTFYRLNSKDQYEGTGLGLSLCKKIVERHKGTIEAIGEEGEGATFIIRLPA